MRLKREEDERRDAAGRIGRGNQPEQTSTHAATIRPQAPVLDWFQPRNVQFVGVDVGCFESGVFLCQ